MRIAIGCGLVAMALLLAAFAEGGGDVGQRNADWPLTGRTYTEQRFSPLTQINDANVAQLGLAWHYQFDTDRGQEATPLVVDGVLYTTTTWSKVYRFRRRDRRAEMVVRPEGARRGRLQGLLRRGQPRRRGLERQGLRRRRSTAG